MWPRARRPPPAPPAARHLVAHHHRHAARRSPRRLRQHDRRDAEPRPARARGRDGQHASVHVPLTRPSHVSLFTGLLPGRARHPRQRLAAAWQRACRCSPRSCSSAGFATGGFVSSIVLVAAVGAGRGFDTITTTLRHRRRRCPVPQHHPEARRRHHRRRRSAWLEQQPRAGAPLRVGAPLRPARSLRAARNPTRRATPDARTTARSPGPTSSWAGSTRRSAPAGLRDDTLLVVTSDHGEGLGEHGEAVHGFFVYETTLHVPLIVRGPGVEPGHRAEAVDAHRRRDADGARPARPRATRRRRCPGASLAAALRGASLDDEPTFAESLVPLIHYGWSDLRALRDGRWKYILAPRPELYDLDSDPGELQNLVDSEPAARPRAARRSRAAPARRAGRAARRERRRRRRGAAATCSRSSARSATSAGAGSAVGHASGADPKDKIEEYKIAQHADARRADRPARRPLRRQPRAVPAPVRPRHRQLRGALLRGARAGRPQALARGGRPLRRPRSQKLPAYTAAYLGLADARLAGKAIRPWHSRRSGAGRRRRPTIRG